MESMTSSLAPRALVADTILRYITAHPDACDSLEGICDWWLVRQRRDDAKRDIANALEDLVAAGLIESSIGPGGLALFHAVRVSSR
jgi:hypothetical protein